MLYGLYGTKIPEYKLVRAKIGGKFFEITVEDDGSYEDWDDFTNYIEFVEEDEDESNDDAKDEATESNNLIDNIYNVYEDDDDNDEDDEDEEDDDEDDEDMDIDEDDDDDDEDDDDDDDDDDDEDEFKKDEVPEGYVRTYDGDRSFTNACDKDWEMLNDIRYTDYSYMIDDNNTYWRMIPGDDPKDFSTVNATNDNDLIYGREHDPRWIKVKKDEEIKWIPTNFCNGGKPIPEEFLMAQEQISEAVAEKQKNFKAEDRHGYIVLGDYNDYYRAADDIEDYIVLRRKQLERARNKAWINPYNHRLRYMNYTYEPTPEEIYAYNRQRAFEELEGTTNAIAEVKKLKKEIKKLYKEKKKLEKNPPSIRNKKEWGKYDAHIRDIKGEIIERESKIKAYNDPNLGYNLGDFSAPAKSKEQVEEEKAEAEREIRNQGIISIFKYKTKNFGKKVKKGIKSIRKSFKRTMKNAKKFWRKNGLTIIKGGVEVLTIIAGIAVSIAKIGGGIYI